MSELYYIDQLTEGKVNEPAADEAREYAVQYGFPDGPDRDILGISYMYGNHLYEKGEKEGAKYCLGIFYDLTGDEKTKSILEKLADA